MENLSKLERLRRKYFHVEIVVGIAAFCSLLISPLKTEYLYQRVADQYNASKEVISDCDNSSRSHLDDIVSQESSRWSLLIDVCMFFPASFTGFFVTTLGDKFGRKAIMVLPLVGQILGSLMFSMIVKYKLPLETMYIYAFISGITGYLMTLLMQAGAYITDITRPETRSMRMLMLEMIVGVGGGLGGVISGIWSSAAGGFFQPMFTTTFLSLLSLILLPILPDSRKISRELTEERAREGITTEKTDADLLKEVNKQKKGVEYLRRIFKVYTSEISHCDICFSDDMSDDEYPTEKCIHGGGRYTGRIWRIWSYLIIYNGVMANTVALMSIQTLFVMSKPLCFTETMVGLQTGLKFAATAFSPLLVLFYQKIIKLSNDAVIFVSLMGIVSSCLLMAFSTRPWMVFVAMLLAGLSMPAKPFSQSQLSKLVSETEHGAVFSLLSFAEILTFLFATVAFLLIYKATVSIMHGMTYLICISVVVAPLILSGAILVSNSRKKNEEKQPLLS